MHLAAERNDIKLLKLLIENGANVKELNDANWTILHSAASGIVNEKEDWEVVKWLLENGADPSVRAVGGVTIEDVLSDESFYLVEQYRKILGEVVKKNKEAESIMSQQMVTKGK